MMKGVAFLLRTVNCYALNSNFGRYLKTGVNNHFCRYEYTSAISLGTLYPDSSLKITTLDVQKVCEEITDDKKFSGHIPIDKLIIKHSRSSGPGGQNVQKTNTKVEVRFHIDSADWLHDDIKAGLLDLKKNSITKDGFFIMKSDKTRSQHLNLADVLQRIRTIIYKIADTTTKTPSPESEERVRKRKEKANRERLKTKRYHSMIKQSRNIHHDY